MIMTTKNKQHKLDTNKVYIYDEAKSKWVGYSSLKFAFNKMLGYPQKLKNGSEPN